MSFHRPYDFDCSLCERKPSLRDLKGCNTVSKEPLYYPPIDMKWEGDRVRIDRCPAKVVTPDVAAVFSTHAMSGGTLTFSEQKKIPSPYLQAWSLISSYRTLSAMKGK